MTYFKKYTGIVFQCMVAGLCLYSLSANSQVSVTVELSDAGSTYSKYIFGKNNSLSDNPEKPLSDAEWLRLKDSGITIFRENGGNNSTKYNWRRKLSSDPDWYNDEWRF